MIKRGVIRVVVALCLWPFPRVAQTTATSQPDAERKADLDAFLADAQEYAIVLQKEAAVALQLVPQPVMNWNGSAFVWTERGRPEVIGTFWKGRDNRTAQPRWQHAFHSLSEHPVTAQFHGQLVWSPRAAGVRFRPVDAAEAPADRPWRRLVQMRELASDFSVSGLYPRYESPRRTLRLLTQPIFRYASPPTVEDGAIFVYSADVVVTDPDALLILEARHSDSGLRWEFTFARFHYIELTGFYRDKEVWKVEDDFLQSRQHRFGSDPGRDSIYYTVTRPELSK